MTDGRAAGKPFGKITHGDRKCFITILCTIIDLIISKLSPFIILFILFRWYKKMMG